MISRSCLAAGSTSDAMYITNIGSQTSMPSENARNATKTEVEIYPVNPRYAMLLSSFSEVCLECQPESYLFCIPNTPGNRMKASNLDRPL